MFKAFFFCCCFLLCLCAISQNTVGILSIKEELSDPGYNLFFAHNQSTTYLTDACGQIVHQWEDDLNFRPGNAVYLLENGNIVKCKRDNFSAVNDPIWAGGGGETVEVRTWNNELLASVTINDSISRLHHDVAPLPNGNILMIVWEVKDKEEALVNGRNPDLMDQDEVWSLAVLEWNPIDDEMVWEWHAWDHLIQDFDASHFNFGNIDTNPGLIDLNYVKSGNPDWLHTNAIDYNPVLDQIVLSIPNFDELWIIDHSTTTEEASTAQGGNAGHGGELLYRWGNPRTYQRGDVSFQKLHFQHDVHWINPLAKEGEENYGKLALFNNRLPNDISTVNVLQTENVGFDYDLSASGTFLPLDFEQTIIHPDGIQMASSASVSSAQVLPNNNLLVCSGRWGYAYEITEDNDIVWEYRVPLKGGSAVSQGDTLAIGENLTFRMKRYPLDFPAFEGKDLAPKNYIELNPDTAYCEQQIFSMVDDLIPNDDLIVFPNPTEGVINIETEFSGLSEYSIIDVAGEVMLRGVLQSSSSLLDISNLSAGIYFLQVGESNFHKIIKY